MATIRLFPDHVQQSSNPSGSEKSPKSRKQVTFQVRMSFLTTLLLISISLVCFQYLAAFNEISSQGVVINELQRERARLIIENEVWNMRIAQLKSMDVIERQDVVKRMPSVLPAELEFIDLDRFLQNEGSR